jgi:hypothetical protein
MRATAREGPTWAYERALQTARELERLAVFWLEEPLDRHDFDGLRRLCAAVEIFIAGGENNKGLHKLRWLIKQDVYDVTQPEAMMAETLTSIRKIASLGELHRKLVAPTTVAWPQDWRAVSERSRRVRPPEGARAAKPSQATGGQHGVVGQNQAKNGVSRRSR